MEKKGSLSHSALLKAVPDFLQKSLHFDALLKQVADFSLSSFTLKKSCFSLLCPYWGHWASNQWQNCEELLSEEHRKQNKLAADAPFSVAPFALSENRFGRNAVVAILESDHLRSLCAAVLQSANDKVFPKENESFFLTFFCKAFGLSVLRVADFLTQVARSCKRVSELSKLADRIANAEQVSIPYVRSALIRFRETMSKRLAKKTEETKATVPEAVAETEAQRKQRMREEAKARQAAIQLKMQQRLFAGERGPFSFYFTPFHLFLVVLSLLRRMRKIWPIKQSKKNQNRMLKAASSVMKRRIRRKILCVP